MFRRRTGWILLLVLAIACPALSWAAATATAPETRPVLPPKSALDLKPDVVTIMLGTNDSKPDNWKNKDEFAADYKDMIARFKKANPKVRIYCCLPIPAYPGRWGINDATIKGQIVPLVRKVAKDTESDVIDLYTPMIGKGEFVPDTVHPSGDGHAVMVKTIFKALTGKDMPETAKASGK